jgi:hypothetical protein
MRILLLIISGGVDPLYAELKEACRANITPPNVTRIFTEYSTDVTELTLKGDTIFLPGGEAYEGIIHKTICGIEYMLKDESFTHVIRSNLSSVWCFPRLVSHLEKQPKTRMFMGVIGTSLPRHFVSGAGMYMTRDVALQLVNIRYHVHSYGIYNDDIAISFALADTGVGISSSAERFDFGLLHLFHENKHSLPESVFHFRMKLDDHRSAEPAIMRELMEILPKA